MVGRLCEKVTFVRVQEYHLILYNNCSDSSDSGDSSDGSDSSDSSDISDIKAGDEKKLWWHFFGEDKKCVTNQFSFEKK